MAKIAEAISAWGQKNISGSGVMTRATDQYNHMQAALQELLTAPWAQMDIPEPGANLPAQDASSGARGALPSST